MKIILNITIAIRPHKHIDRRDDPLSYLIKEIGLPCRAVLGTISKENEHKNSSHGRKEYIKIPDSLRGHILFAERSANTLQWYYQIFFVSKSTVLNLWRSSAEVLLGRNVSASKRHSIQPGNELIIVIRGWKIACMGFIFLGIPKIVLHLIQVDIKAVSAACKWYFWYASPFWLVQAPFGASSDFF